MGLSAILAGGGALANVIGGSQKRKAQRDFNKQQAEITRHSDFGAAGPGQIKQVSGSMLGDAIGGGLAGAKFGQQFGGGAPSITSGAPPAASSAMNMTQPQSLYQGVQNPFKPKKPQGGFGSFGNLA